jgi:SCY1-like protein 2
MDVLNKLRSTVSNTVSQLSSVLPGNPVTREFEATCHIASAGPGNVFIHNLCGLVVQDV